MKYCACIRPFTTAFHLLLIQARARMPMQSYNSLQPATPGLGKSTSSSFVQIRVCVMSLNTANVSALCVGKRPETYLRSFAPLGNGPIYVLIRHFDVASLAMDATRNDSNRGQHQQGPPRISWAKNGRNLLLGIDLEPHA